MKPNPTLDTEVLDRRAQRNWLLMAGICFASTLGLGLAVLPILKERIDSPWPWRHTEIVLLTGLLSCVIGAVLYLTDQQRKATAIHRELLRSREKAAERMRRHNARLEALLNVSRIMATETGVEAVFEAISRTCLDVFTCSQVSIMLLDKDTQELEVRAASGHSDMTKVTGTRVKVGEGVSGHVAAKGQAIILGPGNVDPDRFRGAQPPVEPLSAAMVVPILVRDELVGVLNVGCRSPETRYDEEDLQALKVFAENVGTCIRHAEQAEWMRQMIRKLDPARQESQTASK